MATATLITQSSTGKRVNFVLSERAYSDLVALAKQTNRTMTELVRLGLGLLKIAIDSEHKGHRLIVADHSGQAIKEIVLPA